MYRLTNLKTGEVVLYKTLEEAETMRKAHVYFNNMRYNEFGIGYKDCKRNYHIDKIQ